MRTLIIGGTRFVGRHTVEAALAAGHAVTLLNRGRSGPPNPGTRQVTGDRRDPVALAQAAASGPFDAVIDCCAYWPQEVAMLADALDGQGFAGRYALISTISVYGGDDPPVPPGVDEDDPVVPALHPDAIGEDARPQYGPLKVACEEVARERFASCPIVRPGLVVGPLDPTGRFTYWVDRLAEGGRVLAPGSPDRLVTWVDGRDLGELVARVAAEGPDATLNAVCPPQPFGEVLERIGGAVGFEGELVWVDDQPLLDAGVAPWSDLPLWLPAPLNGMLEASGRRAADAGLPSRPVEETAADLLGWLRREGDAAPPIAGLTREREAQLLADLAT